MSLPLYIVDAFTAHPFAGNPAAVCLLEAPREAAWMQAVAAEMNLAETAFLVPREQSGSWDLRWFTPKVEVSLCGHATLASAHVLWQRGEAAEALTFHTHSGPLGAVREGTAIRLDFPADPPHPVEAPAGLAEALGVRPHYVGRGRDDLLVALEAPEAVHGLAPDMARLAAIDTRGVIVTAPGEREGTDFISRFFAPAVGIPEDPVTGSAHCLLAPYWAGRLGGEAFSARQVSARGGELAVRLQGDRVHIVGAAVTTLEGVLHG